MKAKIDSWEPTEQVIKPFRYPNKSGLGETIKRDVEDNLLPKMIDAVDEGLGEEVRGEIRKRGKLSGPKP